MTSRQAVGAGKDHHNAIQSQRNATVRGRAVLQRFQEKSKAGPRFFFSHTQSAKDFALDILAMNTD